MVRVFFVHRKNVDSWHVSGEPHWTTFPIRKISFEVSSVNGNTPVQTWLKDPNVKAVTLTSSRDEACNLSLKKALQYTDGAAHVETRSIFQELTDVLHRPPNHQVLPVSGNQDGVAKCFRILGDRGDWFLADEFTFSGLVNAPMAHGVRWIPIKLDEGGLIPDEMERVLSTWDNRRGRRPHVLYSVP